MVIELFFFADWWLAIFWALSSVQIVRIYVPGLDWNRTLELSGCAQSPVGRIPGIAVGSTTGRIVGMAESLPAGYWPSPPDRMHLTSSTRPISWAAAPVGLTNCQLDRGWAFSRPTVGLSAGNLG